MGKITGSYGGGSYGSSPIVGKASAPRVGAPPGASSFFLTNPGSSGGRGSSGTCPPGYKKVVIGRGIDAFSKCVPQAAPPRPIINRPAPAPVIKTRVNVSPTFQQSFTPQFSPTMQQQQDSPGASQGASPAQEIKTAQSVEPPSGESESTKRLREEIELLRLRNLMREMTPYTPPPVQAPPVQAPPVQAPPAASPEVEEKSEMEAPYIPPPPPPQPTVTSPVYTAGRTYSEAAYNRAEEYDRILPESRQDKKPVKNLIPWILSGIAALLIAQG